MSSEEVGCLLGQPLLDGPFEGTDFRMAALAQPMMLHVVPDRFDLGQFRTVAGEVMQRDPRSLQCWPFRLDPLTLMHRVVVQPDRQLPLPPPALRADSR